MERIPIDSLIDDAMAMEPLPESVKRLRKLFSTDDWALPQVVDVIRLDGPLTSRILRVANSAAYCGRSPIGTIQQATGRLGPRTVLSLAMAGAVRSALSQALPPYGLDAGELWRHSVTCALAAEELAREVGYTPVDEAFTAGLLHDFGKMLIARYLDDEVQRLIGLAQTDGGRNPLEAESEVLELHHGEIGMLTAQTWQLPDVICQAIAHHHGPEAAPAEARELARITWAANLLAEGLVGSEGEEDETDFGDLERAADAVRGRLEEKRESVLSAYT